MRPPSPARSPPCWLGTTSHGFRLLPLPVAFPGPRSVLMVSSCVAGALMNGLVPSPRPDGSGPDVIPDTPGMDVATPFPLPRPAGSCAASVSSSQVADSGRSAAAAPSAASSKCSSSAASSKLQRMAANHGGSLSMTARPGADQAVGQLRFTPCQERTASTATSMPPPSPKRAGGGQLGPLKKREEPSSSGEEPGSSPCGRRPSPKRQRTAGSPAASTGAVLPPPVGRFAVSERLPVCLSADRLEIQNVGGGV